jgi:phage replication-related protein YjqB (UPF0714/DUF867 family)
MDKYKSYIELASAEREGIDFSISLRRRRSTLLVMAPHGGLIEPVTAELASEIAGSDFSYYGFIGTKRANNSELHITSHKFDEPKCLDLLMHHQTSLAIHGCKGEGERVFIGGLNEELIGALGATLRRKGLDAQTAHHAYPGRQPKNVCNRCASGRGVQFELTMNMRKGRRAPEFVAVVREALLAYEGQA